MDSWERFDETKLPTRDSFYSKLNGVGISDEDYQHAETVWASYNCKNIGDYHNLCNQTDVVLFADVFEIFRKTCMNVNKLDPAHHYTSPGLSWDALLKKTEIKLKLLTDYDKHLFIGKDFVVIFLWFLKDMQRLITNTSKIMILTKK